MSGYTGPPPSTNRPSETDPLMPGKASLHRSVSLSQCIIVLVITFGIFASVFPRSSCNNPLDPDVRDRIREEWDVERRQHQDEVLKRIDIEQRWSVEDDERIHLREQWMQEMEEHERNLSEAIRRENQDKEARRTQWDAEAEEHERNLSEAIRRENQDKEARRTQWGAEAEEHQRNLSEAIRRENQEKEARRAQWEREAEEHNREEKKRRARWNWEAAQRSAQWGREEEEHNRAVERKRLRLNMFWTDPEPHTCTTYGTREYTARLVNVPADYDYRVEACMATPIQVHGVEYKAKWCEDHGPSNVIGHWEVNQHEPDCASYWNWYKDWGCVSPGSGQRRIEHYLENLPQGADWREFCATTPASFRGMHSIGAQFCFQRNFGVYGHWVLDDESCN